LGFLRSSKSIVVNRAILLLVVLMFAASVGAIVVRPDTKAAERGPAISLEAMVPKRFTGWQEEEQRTAQMVNPQTKELLDKLYSQILSRTYVDANGYRIMLSMAYGSDQRGALQAHKPEVCYPAQGFKLHDLAPAELHTDFGNIAASRLFASLRTRNEPVTYWFTVGDSAVKNAIEKRIVELRYGLTGQIPDGLLFRVSSIDPDRERAYRMQERFINDLLASVSPVDRLRLSGLGEKRTILQ
jgi:EpsI family protein